MTTQAPSISWCSCLGTEQLEAEEVCWTGGLAEQLKQAICHLSWRQPLEVAKVVDIGSDVLFWHIESTLLGSCCIWSWTARKTHSYTAWRSEEERIPGLDLVHTAQPVHIHSWIVICAGNRVARYCAHRELVMVAEPVAVAVAVAVAQPEDRYGRSLAGLC